jgi:hypothetical protein
MNTSKEWFQYYKNRITRIITSYHDEFPIIEATNETFIYKTGKSQNIDTYIETITKRLSDIFGEDVLFIKSARSHMTLYEVYFNSQAEIFIFSLMHYRGSEQLHIDFEKLDPSSRRVTCYHLHNGFSNDDKLRIKNLFYAYLEEIYALPEFRLLFLTGKKIKCEHIIETLI